MSALNVRSQTGERFAVAGNWLFDGDAPIRSRIVGGIFHVTVLAASAGEAIEIVAEMMQKDIIVTGLEIVR